jgi:hypothetical protein
MKMKIIYYIKSILNTSTSFKSRTLLKMVEYHPSYSEFTLSSRVTKDLKVLSADNLKTLDEVRQAHQ